jgi:hypothetical protein
MGFLGGRIKEQDVTRTRSGKTKAIAPGQRDYDVIRAYARHVRDMEDRVGPAVRFHPDINGWWYMVKGPQRWIRQTSTAGWHHGYYYQPGNWWPVVPPRDQWESRTSYNGPPGAGFTYAVPPQVKRAALLHPLEMKGYRPAYDGSARREAKKVVERRETVSDAVGYKSTKKAVTRVSTPRGKSLVGGGTPTVTKVAKTAPKRPTMNALVKKATTARKKAR